ncbi:AraC family transcriptional regulator [Terriglobus albidus]|uniref:AraC family transcriptional regulator n=1 Tax=Terriglobus albidus TaxID=1592106 RepID=UPI0021DF56C7|nr:AraC family transcriptional regulator [Terriglobus albidus]
MRERLQIRPEFDGNVWLYHNLGWTNRRHHHAELELNIVTRGTGSYLLGSRKYQIRSGDLIWLFPAQEHVLFEESADFEMWIAVFKRRAVKRFAIDEFSTPLLKLSREGECCRRLTSQELSRMEAHCADLLAGAKQPGFLNAGLSYLLLYAWQCFERAGTVPVRDVHPAVERAARLLRDEDNTLNLDELARRSGLSAARLSRLFKQQTGFAMVDFRNRQRIDRFLDIYGNGQRQTMLDAALEAGFGSYPQFHRVFRRIMGCAPGEYRRGDAS